MRKIYISILLLARGSISTPTTGALSNAPHPVENTTPPSLHLPINATNLTAPRPPPGFTTNLIFDRTKPLNLLSLFKIGIELMYALSQYDWNYIIPSDAYENEEDDNLGITIGTSVAHPAAQNQLQIGYAILGLYELLTTMILHRDLYEVEAELKLRGYEIGNIRVLATSKMSALPNLSLSAPITNDSGIANSLKSDSGSIGDDLGFRISYTYDSTSRINSQDLFMAFLDGLATAAEPHEQRSCKLMFAVSPLSATGQAVITISAEDHRILTYKSVTTALYLIWTEIIFPGSRFGDLELEIYYVGIKVGRVLIDSLPPLDRISGTVTVV